jgi:hypothetical protein
MMMEFIKHERFEFIGSVRRRFIDCFSIIKTQVGDVSTLLSQQMWYRLQMVKFSAVEVV